MPAAVTGVLPPLSPAAAAVRARIDRAAIRAGRDPASVTLVAAAKTVAAARTLAAGVADVGENRVQELAAKQQELAGYPIRWHFIGRLQRNKVTAVAGRVALVHSIDTIDLARSVGRVAHAAGTAQPVLIQVNVSGEASKGGIPPADVEAFLGELRAIEGIEPAGLMTIPAPSHDQAVTRAAFRALARAAAAAGLSHVSMGMSDDFEIAVEEGATIVRVGTAIFGPRETRGAG